MKNKPDRIIEYCLIFLATVGGSPDALRLPLLKILVFITFVLSGFIIIQSAPRWAAGMWWIVGYGAALIIGAVFASLYAAPLIALAQWATMIIATILSSTLEAPHLKKTIKRVLLIYYFIAALQLTISIIQLTTIAPPPRIPSLLWNPNNFGFVLLGGFIFALLEDDKKMFVITAFFMVLTGSRVNWAATLIGAILLFVFHSEGRAQFSRPLTMIASPIFIAGSGSLWFVHPFIGRGSTLGVRLTYWGIGWDMFRQRPLMGFGGWSTFAYHLSIADRLPEPYIYAHSHSTVINILAEGGVVAVAFASGLLITISYRAIKQRSIIGGVYISALFFSMIFDYYFWVPACGVFVGAIWLLIDQNRRPAPRTAIIIIWLVCCGVWLLVLGSDFRAILY